MGNNTIHMTREDDDHDQRQQRVVYTLPGMHHAKIERDIPYKIVEDQTLMLDIYYPASTQTGETLPAVVLIHDDSATGEEDPKDTEQYVSWGKLIAASGMIAVVANHRRSDGLRNVVGATNDIDDLITFLHEQSHRFAIHSNRLGIWTCSTGLPMAGRTLLHDHLPFLRCMVSYYGIPDLKTYYTLLYGEERSAEPLFSDDDFDEFSVPEMLTHNNKRVPWFIARAGLDNPILNSSIDHLISTALQENIPLTVMNHPAGHHGFDIRDKHARTKEIIQATLAFLKTHLLG